LAALCIDPSSTLTGGSILGDKTRMTELSRHPKAFVRPSPSRGDLGGVTSYTNDAVTLCQAAGYDLVMVETVGIGQSEVSVSQVVDMLILIVAPGGGDGLQGVKKGILEVADLLIVNKADGHLLPVAQSTAADYKGAMHFMRSRVEGWEAPPVLLASAITKDGFSKVWEEICKYRRIMTDNGELDRRKGKQARYWMWNHVQDLISLRIKSDSRIGAMANDVEMALDQGTVSPRVAASDLLQCLNLTFHSKND
jgi:LAO/AO transport system kinase